MKSLLNRTLFTGLSELKLNANANRGKIDRPAGKLKNLQRLVHIELKIESGEYNLLFHRWLKRYMEHQFVHC